MNKFFLHFDRTLSFFIALFIFIVLLPILLLVMFFLFLVQGRPLFYVSSRHIAPDKTIRSYKFRSMIKDATHPRYRLEERFMRDGYLDIPLSCEVYTPIGRFLERTQLVESLQLLNILKGGMRLVGNRPLPKANIEMLKKYKGWERRFQSPCGLTGITQIVGKFNLQPEIRLNLESIYAEVYQKGNILKCDFWIILYTVRLILTQKPLTIPQAYELLQSCLPIQCPK